MITHFLVLLISCYVGMLISTRWNQRRLDNWLKTAAKQQITLPADTVEFMSNLAREMKTQNNRGTRSPYFYVVRGMSEYAAADGCGQDTGYYDPDMCESYSEKEIKERYEEWLRDQANTDDPT